VRDVPVPEPGPGEVLVRGQGRGHQPGARRRSAGSAAHILSRHVPSEQGSDFAGVVDKLGPDRHDGRDRRRRDRLGSIPGRVSRSTWWRRRRTCSQAGRLPGSRGGDPVVGFTAWAWSARSTSKPGDTVVVSSAAGGVGSIAVHSPAKGANGDRPGRPVNQDWLTRHGVIPVNLRGRRG